MNSIWVFLLLASESIKTYKANPYLEYVEPLYSSPEGYQVPEMADK